MTARTLRPCSGQAFGAFLLACAAAAGCECGALPGVRCETSADCPAGAVCDPGFGLCVALDVLDSGSEVDGGQTDGGDLDGGLDLDGGPDVDAGLGEDAGPGVDAGPGADAGPVDAGPGDGGPRDAGPGDAGPRDAGPGDAGPRDAGPGDAGPGDAGPQCPTCDAGSECYQGACVPSARVRITSPAADTRFGRVTFAVDIQGSGPGGVVSMRLRGTQNSAQVFDLAAAANGPGAYRANVDATAAAVQSGLLTLVAVMTYDPLTSRTLSSAPVVVRIDKTAPTIQLQLVYPDRSTVADAALRSELTNRYRRVENVVLKATITDTPAAPVGAGVNDASIALSAPGLGAKVPVKSGNVYTWTFPAKELTMGFGEGQISLTVTAADLLANAGSATAAGEFTRLKWWYSHGTAIAASPIVYPYSLPGGRARMVAAVGQGGTLFAITDNGWPQDGIGQSWTLATGSNTSSSPALAQSPESYIYLGAEDGKLRAVHSVQGSLQVTCPAIGPIFSTPAVGQRVSNNTARRLWVGDGLLNDTGTNHLHEIDVSSTQSQCDLRRQVDRPAGVLASPVVSQVSFGIFGNGPWINSVARRVATGGNPDTRWQLWGNDQLFLGGAEKRIGLNGAVATPAVGSPALSENFVVVATNDQNLLVAERNSNMAAGAPYAVGAALRSTPAIGLAAPNDTRWVYIVDSAGHVHGVPADASGFHSGGWKVATGASSSSAFEASPVLGQGGNAGRVYAPAPNGVLWALDAENGAVLWKYPDTARRTPPVVLSSPALWCDGTIYFGAQDGRLYAVTSDSPAILNAPWPRWRRDNQNTGNLASALETSATNCP